MTSICHVCEREVIRPYGYTKSSILIVGDQPGKDELKALKPYVGGTGKVLRQELALAGLDLFQLRTVNIWYHKALEKSHKNFEACFKASLDVVLQEAKGKKAILLIGANPVEYFTGYKVSDVTGLQVDCNMLSAPIIYAMLQPAVVFKTHGVGEIRFALNNFVTHIKKEGIM